jgi:magnesium-transporting ATPase (P-type)
LDLLLCIEIAKFLCTPFMEADVQMKIVDVIPTGGDSSIQVIKGFKANTLNLHEDLAEVEYIFADKTGTLTQNELVFREIAILYHEDIILIQHPDQKDRKQINLKAYPAAQDFFTCLAVCQDCITS